MTHATLKGVPAWLAHPYMLLTLTALFWGGNAVAGRLAVGTVSPMTMVTLRWLIVCVLFVVFMRKDLAAAWPVLRQHGRFIGAMGALGFTAFNALFYVAAHHTTALNIGIIQGAIPIFVLIGAYLAYRTRIALVQVAGMAVTLVGVIVITAKGDWTRLATLAFNFGDILILIACALYAGYTVGLRRRPPVSGLALFAAMASVAMLTSLPLLAIEIARGEAFWPTPAGWAIVFYVALFPSLVAQLFFMRGVELIGPGRAGVFVNLVPVFAAILAVAILDEAFGWYHAVALALVLGGIAIAERAKR